MTLPEHQDRLQAYLDDELSSEDRADLESQLKANPALAEALFSLAREEAILGEWARVIGWTRRIDDQSALRRRPNSSLRSWLPLMFAASVLFAIGVRFWSQTSTVPPLAVVEHFEGRVFIVAAGVRTPASPKSELFSGQGLEVQGDDSSAVVKYADGTRLELDGDTVVTDFSGGDGVGKRIVLAEGNLRASVTKQSPGQPMVLKTKNAEVTVLGTKFDLSGNMQTTYVETTEGTVRLTRAGDGLSIEVPAGFEGCANNDPNMNVQPSPPRFRRSLLTTPGNHRTTAMSPDGQTLATTRFGTGQVTFWSTATAQARLSFEAHAASIDVAAFSTDGKTFATGGRDRNIKLWDSATGQPLQTLAAPEKLEATTFSDGGKTLLALTGHPSHKMHLYRWDLTTYLPRGEPQPLRGEAWAFSPTGRLLAVFSVRDSSVIVWDTVTNRERATFLRPPGGRVLCLALSQDESQLAISHSNGTVTIWDLDSAERVQTLYSTSGSVQGLSFSPDGANLAMGLRYATVRVWDLATGKPQYLLEGDRRPGSTASVRPMLFTPDGKFLATSESLGDSIVRLWNLPPLAPLR